MCRTAIFIPSKPLIDIFSCSLLDKYQKDLQTKILKFNFLLKHQAVVFADILFILGGRTRDGTACYNDVWVFVQDKAAEAKYQLVHYIDLVFFYS
jgi:hypothetical protein